MSKARLLKIVLPPITKSRTRFCASPICFSIFFIAVISPNLLGQEPQKRNTAYLELGCNALFTSVNYERQVFKNTGLCLHIGTGIYGLKPSYSTIPFGVNYLFKISNFNRYLDVGMGITYSKADVLLYINIKRADLDYVNTNYWNYIPSVGFRWITNKKFMFRFTITPVINQYGLIPFCGLAAGKCF